MRSCVCKGKEYSECMNVSLRATVILWLCQMRVLVGAEASRDSNSDGKGPESLLAVAAASARTTFAPHPVKKAIIAVHIEDRVNWWGNMEVYHHTGDHIDWVATLPEEYTENCGHYLISCSWVYLNTLETYALEVFDSTHLGNGSLWLFALEGSKLRLLLHTWAVDSYNENVDVFPPIKGKPLRDGNRLDQKGTVILNGRLNAQYNAGGDRQKVILTGTIVTMLNEKAVSSNGYSESWVWNAKRRVFTRLHRTAIFD